MPSSNVPRREEGIKRDFEDCEKRGRFTRVPPESYRSYTSRAQKDLASAQRDWESGDYPWCIVKAYQAVYAASNAVLVRHYGYYAKDHKCVLAALRRERLLSPGALAELERFVPVEEATTEADELRMERNYALYVSTAWSDITRERAEEVLQRARRIAVEVFSAMEG